MSFRWTRPSQVNGVLEFYSIFLSRDGAEPVLAYNSSDLFEDHTLRNLTPGSIYTVTVSVSPGSSRVPTPHAAFHTRSYAQNNGPLCLSLSGVHRGRVHAEPTQPSSNRGEHPGERPRTAGHPFVPACTQRQLGATSHSER